MIRYRGLLTPLALETSSYPVGTRILLTSQHSDEPNIKHAKRKADGTVEVRAAHDLKAGEELFNQYRPEEEEAMPYHRFFTRYGFIPGVSIESIPGLLSDKSSIFVAQSAEV
jgi:SET domain-containing protein